MDGIEIGRLLRATTSGFVVGCRVSQLTAPSFGALVRVPLEKGYQIYGLIHDIHIEDDGLVRQLVTAEGISDAILADNRLNRNVPVEMGVLTLGYQQGERISHLLPPRPPLSLDVIYACTDKEICQFTSVGRFGYFRHILRAKELPTDELLAAHLIQTQSAQKIFGDSAWVHSATQELIILLRDEYPTLMAVLSAVNDAFEHL
jgi:hypothetical protein